MANLSKRMKKLAQSVDPDKHYLIDEALDLIKNNASTKFDETVEVAINLNIDTKQTDQVVRGVVALPKGSGKTVRVAVFAKDAKAKEAQEAGADIVGADDLIEKISSGAIDFDRCIATPDMMGLVGKVARILGPKGLMPNPKLGTVTPNVAKAIQDAKSGQVQYRADKSGIVHAGIGKASFSAADLKENFNAFLGAVVKAKPSASKGKFLKKLALSSTMGVGVRVELASLEAS